MQDIILIIDFMNYLHRCRVGDLDGEYVLVYNFFRNLRVTVEQFQPAKIFFALDGYPKHRHEIYSGYKANRIIKLASQTEALQKVFSSSDLIRKLLLYLPITLAFHSDFEADDIIFSLMENLKEENVIVVSSDNDCIQLLQQGYSHIEIYNPIKKDFMKSPPYSQLAFKALAGDKSDNIKGLVSPEKAKKLAANPKELQKFLSLSEENRSNLVINKSLIEFKLIDGNEITFLEGNSQLNILKEEFDKMEFASITNDRSWSKFVETFNCIKY